MSDVWGDTSTTGLTRQKSGIQYRSNGEVLQACPSEIVNRFRSVDAREDSLLGEELPELDLSGFGEAYGDCGDDLPRFCSECGRTHAVGRTCYRSTCPRCGAAWCRDRATAVASKLEAVRRFYESKRSGWGGYKFHHLALSPPDGYETFSKDSLNRTYDVLKEVLDELGCETGVMFYHPYRGKDGDDRGFWKDLLWEGNEWSDVREQLEHSPHFHAVVVAKHVDGGHVTKAIESQTGWIVERITKNESDVSIYGKYDLARVVSYCLSHTGLREKGDRTEAAYRYFGRVANLPAADHITKEIDAAVRSVVPRTLGLPWSDVACTGDREGEPDGFVVADTDAAYGDMDGAPYAETDGEGGGGEKEPPEGTCGGRLLSITKAPAFLDDDDWLARAEHSGELVDAWVAWRDEVDEWGDRVDRPPD